MSVLNEKYVTPKPPGFKKTQEFLRPVSPVDVLMVTPEATSMAANNDVTPCRS